MILKLHITGLTREEQEEVLKQLELIKDAVYPDLNIDRSILKRSPNWIRINQEIDDINNAVLLLQCFQSLHINHMWDDYYEIYEDIKLHASLECNKEWIMEGVDYD